MEAIEVYLNRDNNGLANLVGAGDEFLVAQYLFCVRNPSNTIYLQHHANKGSYGSR